LSSQNSRMGGESNFNQSEDQEAGGYGGMSPDSFGDKAVRLGFIRKVYAILSAQLAVTLAIIGVFMIPSVQKFSAENQWLLLLAVVVSFVVLFMLICPCCGDMRRKAPGNFILLGVFTLAEGFMIGTITSHYNVSEVMIAVGVTSAVVLALTIFAFQTKIDFTAMGGILLAVLVVFSLFGLIAIFFPRTQTVRLVYAAIGAIIFSVYIVYDTQLMIGGEHKYSLSPEEYIFASLKLYLDIINLFIFILSIIGNSRH